jgi:tellurite methyltransferase
MNKLNYTFQSILLGLNLILFTLIYSNLSFAQQNNATTNLYEGLSGNKINNKRDIKKYWDQKYSKKKYLFGKNPSLFLQKNIQYLIPNSKILDMGMGEGRNAIFLSENGFNVTGIDISSVAIKKAHRFAKEKKVKIKTIIASLNDYKFHENTFDAIISIDFVDRDLVNKMKKWVKPGGIIIYEAYTTKQRNRPGFKTRDPRFFLHSQELLTLFPKSTILKFEEPIHESQFKSSIIIQVNK